MKQFKWVWITKKKEDYLPVHEVYNIILHDRLKFDEIKIHLNTSSSKLPVTSRDHPP